MSITVIFLLAFFFSLMGVAYCRGYDVVKRNNPEKLPNYYMLFSAIRVVLVLTLVAVYLLLVGDAASRLTFALVVIVMYLIMMLVTLIYKH